MTHIKPKKYSLQEINEIALNRFVCDIPSKTIDIINELSTKVGSPSYIKTPIFNKRNSTRDNFSIKTSSSALSVKKPPLKKKSKISTDIFNDDDWDTIRSFEVTKINQTKEGLPTEIVNIRKLMNMMTETNYLDKQIEIKTILDNIQSNYSQEDMKTICLTILEIASENKFYSSLYSNVYTHLSNEYPIMITILIDKINEYTDSIKNMVIENVVEYDDLCKMNKQHDKQKAFASFIMNLTKSNTIELHYIIHIVNIFFQELLGLIQKENEKKKVDEIVENIAILYYPPWFEDCRSSSMLGDLSYKELIQAFARMKVKQYPSITNKSIFKFMDIVENK